MLNTTYNNKTKTESYKFGSPNKRGNLLNAYKIEDGKKAWKNAPTEQTYVRHSPNDAQNRIMVRHTNVRIQFDWR